MATIEPQSTINAHTKTKQAKSRAARRAPLRLQFPIVGIGASAGGLEAITELLRSLPPDTGMGFVLVQHLDPTHESVLTQILGRATAMTVKEVTNDQPVEPNHVYIIPPNTALTVKRAMLKLETKARAKGPHHSIDVFFESLARDRREQAIGVILSGTATDGTLGLEAIKAANGIAFAQDDSAKYTSMPHSAIAAGCVDFVLSPAEIAAELTRLARHPYVVADVALSADGRAVRKKSAKLGVPGYFESILSLLRSRFGVDFSLYKPSTIERRIARRMALNRLPTPAAYAKFLREDAAELKLLYSDVLINVTSFFRNPEVFEVLKRDIFPRFLAQQGDEPVRMWILGCSTGQEAFSLAMAFVECAERAERPPNLQIFAMDLNEASLEKARTGLYAKSMLHDVSPARLKRFFIPESGGFRVAKNIREMVVFARQNILSDPPFSRMDLVSCRNVMIYLEPSLQKRVLPAFHYALKPTGVLLLGLSESIGAATDLFIPLDKKLKMYSKKTGAAKVFAMPVARTYPTPTPRAVPAKTQTPAPLSAELSAEREADRITIRRFAPPGVLIDSTLHIVQFRGDVSAYLALPSGKAHFSVLNMAHEDLMLPLRAAINKAKTENKTVRKRNVRIARDGRDATIDIEVIPLKNLKEPCYLILFESTAKLTQRTTASSRPPDDLIPAPRARRAEARRIAELEQELAETRDYVQALREHDQANSEGVQAAAEEFQSANEELQSINEELETSKEELESTNEELITVNEEMATRNVELNRVNDDLINLYQSINLPILVLGPDLSVLRFTEQAQNIFNLLATDQGRPLGRIKHNLDCPDLERFIFGAIEAASTRERDIQDKDGRWYILRARPYVTLEKKVNGAVVVLVDIDALKRSGYDIKEARDYAEATLRTARDPFVVLRADLRVNTANEAFYRMFKLSREQVEGRLLYDLNGGAWANPKLRTLLEDVVPRNSYFNDFEVIHDFPTIGRRTMMLNARQLDYEDSQPHLILLSIEDVTERLESREALRVSENRFRRLFEAACDGILLVDPLSRKIIDANPFMTELLGYPTEEFIDKELWQIGLIEDEPSSHAAFRELQENGFIRYEHLPLETKTGERREAEFVSNVYTENGHEVIQCNIRDITARKRIERALGISEERFHAIADTVPVMIWMADAQQRPTYFNKGWLDFVGSDLERMRAHWQDAVHADDRAHCAEVRARAFAARTAFEMEYWLARRDGEYRLVLDVGTPRFAPDGDFIGFIGSCIDITQRRKDQDEASRSNKLESVGVLAGGIAHDFNNLLTAIVGNIYLTKLALSPADDLFTNLTEMENACARAQDLTRQLLTFARGGAPLTKTIAIGEVLLEWTRFSLRGSNVSLVSNIASELWPVDVDEGQLSQVINNLATNAKQAMPDGGTVTLTVRNIALSGEQHELPLDAGRYVCISLRDEGVGIPADHIAKIFDPFFTTKPKGRGLGLATSYTIVQKHGGHLAVMSELGVGTTFSVYLPASLNDVAPAAEVWPHAAIDAGKILFMDDEPTIRRFAREVLSGFGYTVECVEDGQAALERYRLAMENGEPFAGVILDLTVPGGMGGRETLQALLQLDRNVKAVVSSGYSNDPIMATFAQYGFCARLAKPFQMAELRDAVRMFHF